MQNDRKDYFRRYQEEHREELTAYHRQWVSENPDRVREHKRRYREKMRLASASDQEGRE